MLGPAGTEQQLLIPADRVVQVGQLNLVWVLQDGQAYRRFVRVGKALGDQVEILAGLNPGAQGLPHQKTAKHHQPPRRFGARYFSPAAVLRPCPGRKIPHREQSLDGNSR